MPFKQTHRHITVESIFRVAHDQKIPQPLLNRSFRLMSCRLAILLGVFGEKHIAYPISTRPYLDGIQ